MTLRGKVAIAGVGESDIGKVPGLSGLGLNAQAASRAIADAGLQPTDIDGLLTAYTLTEPYFMLGSVMAEYLGIEPRYCASVIAGGASPGVMLHHAAQAIASGQATTVLVVAGENRATGQSRDAAIAALQVVGHPQFEQPYGVSIPACYAMIANRHMQTYGTTRKQLSAVCVTSRSHALMHNNAHMKKPITTEDVIASKPIADPLHMLDCCLISDAAGAFIVTSAERAKDMHAKPVYMLGIGEAHTHEHLIAAPSLTEFGTVRSGKAAYEMAGLGPSDMDFAELYDCFSIVPIIEFEELGLAPRGAGGMHWEDGNASIGGPVNTHGGMLSHAHAGAAGGLLGIVEAVQQLRGGLGSRQVEGAEVGIVHNEGGILSSHATMIFANTLT